MRATFLVVVASVAAAGCGGVQYTLVAVEADARLEEARMAGADRWAPYDYYYARAHLDEAKVQAMEASYSDAISLAETARAHAQAATELAEQAQGRQAIPISPTGASAASAASPSGDTSAASPSGDTSAARPSGQSSP